MSCSRRRWAANQFRAAGLVKSTMPIPACHRSLCHALPSLRSSRKPCAPASAKSGERWAMQGLIHTHTSHPRSCRRASMPGGSGKVRGSHSQSVQFDSRIQKQSKWKTLSGRSRCAMPSMKDMTVASS